MKNRILVFIFCIVVFLANGQTWCYPGSQWHYSRYYQYGSAYARLTFSGSQLVNNKNCKKIEYFTEEASVNGNVTSNSRTFYTYDSLQVVYLLNRDGLTFDTLYAFNANPGAHWLLPANTFSAFLANCSRSKLTVTDTGHTQIEGVDLRMLKVDITSPYNTQVYKDIVIERIGFLNQYFFQFDLCTNTNLHYAEGGSLRCYKDNQIPEYKLFDKDCNYLYNAVGLKKYSDNSILIYPNPAGDFLQIETESSQGFMLTIIDVTGKLLRNISINKREKINITDLPAGFYILKGVAQDKIIFTLKFIKT
jgi:hypothetical protein